MNLEFLKTSVKDYAKEITASEASWTNFTKDVVKVTGNRTLLDYTVGYKQLNSLVMRTPTWTIGGAAFEGIIKTDHSREVRITNYPVQNGAIMSDHAIVMPSELEIQILVSDSYTPLSWRDLKTGNGLIDTLMKQYDRINEVRNIKSITTLFRPKGQVAQSGEGGVNAWQVLSMMQFLRLPIDVVTRLQTYKNMVITNISAPDDVNTLYGLMVNVHLREVHIYEVAEMVESARPHTTQTTQGGAKPVTESDGPTNKTAAKAIYDGIKGVLG